MKRTCICFLMLLLSACSGNGPSNADSTTSSSGTSGTTDTTETGDVESQELTIFLSSEQYTGALDGVTGADETCQQLANDANLDGEFKAWLSDSDHDIADRIVHADLPYVLVNGDMVAQNWDDLVDGRLDHSITLTETNAPVDESLQQSAWTATSSLGTYLEPDCNGWTSQAPEDQGLVGEVESTDNGWTDVGKVACDTPRHLYCIQAELNGDGDGDGDGDTDTCAGIPNAVDGIYQIDPDGIGLDPPYNVYCDMTTDGGGWTMVFKITSDITDHRANDLWTGGPLNAGDDTLLDIDAELVQYVSPFIANGWDDATVTEVRVHLYDDVGTLLKYFKFDDPPNLQDPTNSVEWFSAANYVSSSYVDIMNDQTDIFSIEGDLNTMADKGRRFYIEGPQNGCANQQGWFMVDSQPDSCPWENTYGNGNNFSILYAPGDMVVDFDPSPALSTANVMAVFVR